MNPIELNRSLVQLRLSGMAAVLETRLLQAQSEAMAPIDLISILVSDELACRSKRLLERRHKQAQFRDTNKLLDSHGKTKAIRIPGKKRPAASRLWIQGPPTPESHPRNTGRNTKPSDSQPIGPTAEGFDYRFLRSQPRVIGHGSLRKARPRQSETTISNTTSRAQS